MKNVNEVASVEVVVAVVKGNGTGKTGRKVNVTSARQLRLAEARAKVESGVIIKRGRPVEADSVRQARIAELAVKKADPTFKLGRSIDLTSKRQIRLAELEARRAAGTLKRGRPAKVIEVEINLIDMLKK